MHCHSEPVGGFLPPHRFDALSNTTHIISTSHGSQGTEHQTKGEGQFLGQVISLRAIGSRLEAYPCLIQLFENPVLEQFKVSAPESRQTNRRCQSRCRVRRHTPDMKFAEARAAFPDTRNQAIQRKKTAQASSLFIASALDDT